MRGAETSYRGMSFSERMAAAPCATEDPDLSFPSGTGKRENAHNLARKKTCSRCPLSLRDECLEMAMQGEGMAVAANRYGVFAGLDPIQRARLARYRRAAQADVARVEQIIRNRQRGQQLAAAMEAEQSHLKETA